MRNRRGKITKNKFKAHALYSEPDPCFTQQPVDSKAHAHSVMSPGWFFCHPTFCIEAVICLQISMRFRGLA